MDEERLKQECIRVERSAHRTRLFVGVISWRSPHEPHFQWKRVRTFPAELSDEALAPAVQQLLNDPRYFRHCPDCQQRMLDGWMGSDK